jgi:hypothetical protein
MPGDHTSGIYSYLSLLPGGLLLGRITRNRSVSKKIEWPRKFCGLENSRIPIPNLRLNSINGAKTGPTVWYEIHFCNYRHSGQRTFFLGGGLRLRPSFFPAA